MFIKPRLARIILKDAGQFQIEAQQVSIETVRIHSAILQPVLYSFRVPMVDFMSKLMNL